MTINVAGRGILEALAKPFSDNDIEWRAQTFTSGQNGVRVLVLPYIDSRAAMKRLDEVLGMNWKDEYSIIEVNGQKAFQCALSIKVDGEWITRTDGAEATDIESVKGGYSNAFKRVCVKFGISRHLYDLPQVWLPLEKKGKVYVTGNVKGQKYVGYVNPPSIASLMNQRQPSQPQQSNQHPRANSQQSRQQQDRVQQGNNQQPPQQANGQGQQRPNNQRLQQGNQNQQPNSQRLPQHQNGQYEHQAAFRHVANLIRGLGISENFVNGILQKVGSKAMSIQHASMKELESLYHVLKPVHDFTMVCRKAHLNLDEMLYYATIPLKREINHFNDLFFAMQYPQAKNAIELVLGDQQDLLQKQASNTGFSPIRIV